MPLPESIEEKSVFLTNWWNAVVWWCLSTPLPSGMALNKYYKKRRDKESSDEDKFAFFNHAGGRTEEKSILLPKCCWWGLMMNSDRHCDNLG